jgi:DNA-binding transcriptional MerR regulator
LLRRSGYFALTMPFGGCIELAEYRLEELADLTGVSVRNIRAYRERGLLDPPRRAGRASFYGSHHVAQLRTVTDLLQRGFSSAHIADFFTSVRQGQDLADTLGLRDAVLGSAPASPRTGVVDVDPNDPRVRRMCDLGLADVVDGRLTFVNPDVADIVADVDDPSDRIGALLRVCDAVVTDLLRSHPRGGGISTEALRQPDGDDRQCG